MIFVVVTKSSVALAIMPAGTDSTLVLAKDPTKKITRKCCAE